MESRLSFPGTDVPGYFRFSLSGEERLADRVIWRFKLEFGIWNLESFYLFRFHKLISAYVGKIFGAVVSKDIAVKIKER